eukprot:sb/3464168/
MTDTALLERLKGAVKDAPDFPRPGILFKDIMPVFQDPKLVWDTCEALVDEVKKVGKVDVIIGIEARGFLIGPIMSMIMGIPFVAIRKKGKLPRECFSVKYEKEYGVDEFDMQKDALTPGQKVVVVDDLLATGGTLEAAAKLCEMAKATVITHCIMFDMLAPVSGFRKLNVGSKTSNAPPPTSLKGTRLSLHSSLQQTSTGIQALDLVLGNGVNLSSATLFIERDRGEYTPQFARHFISEGVSHGHTVVCCGERVEQWLETLPTPIQQDEKQEAEPDLPEDQLKIAWRYKRRIQARYSHSYDLSKHIPTSQLSSCHVIPSTTPAQEILDQISDHITKSESVVRVVLDRPFFPDLEDSSIFRFHYQLRQITNTKNSILLCTYPDCIPSSLSFSLSSLYNNSLTINSLPRDKTSVYRDYHGIINLNKVDNMCSFTSPTPDMSDRFFKIQRKKFVVEKMHLPPDLSETVSRSSSTNSGSGGCGGSGGAASALDF